MNALVPVCVVIRSARHLASEGNVAQCWECVATDRGHLRTGVTCGSENLGVAGRTSVRGYRRWGRTAWVSQ